MSTSVKILIGIATMALLVPVVVSLGFVGRGVPGESSEPVELRTYSVPPAQQEEIRRMLRSALDSESQRVGRVTAGPSGTLLVVGFTGGDIATLKTNYLLLKNIGVLGVNWSSYRDADPDMVRRVQEEIFDMYVRKEISMPIQAAFPMEDVTKAFDIIRNREIRGKVVLRMGDAG